MNNYSELSLIYQISLFVLIFLSAEAIKKKDRVWSIPALIFYATTFLWYFLEILLYPEVLQDFSNEIIENAYLQVLLFLVTFRWCIPYISNFFISRKLDLSHQPRRDINSRRLLLFLIALWLFLFLWGVSQLNWDFMNALFPLTGRWTSKLWSRGGGSSAGSIGFLISSAAYSYTLVCAFFGILLPLQKDNQSKLLSFLMIVITWPAFMLSGTRNSFLAVAMPGFFSYIIFSKQKWEKKILFSLFLLFCLNFAFSIVITYRDIGYQDVFQNLSQGTVPEVRSEHQGLNMAQELFYILDFNQKSLLTFQYGKDYFVEFLSFIPRAIWPDKPLLGYYYNVLRGFGDGTNDIGVRATIAAGMIGRGILNFGPWLGAMVPSIIMALWCGYLSMLWSQKHSILRQCLFLLGLGLTPNLGRDITLLVLWPMIFGYFLVRYLEWVSAKHSIHQ